MLLERQVEGIIYATMYHRPADPPDTVRSVPTVLLTVSFRIDRCPLVVPDDIQGGRRATEHLLSKGHSRIGFINNVHVIPATLGRLEGYQQALAGRGIVYDDSWVLLI